MLLDHLYFFPCEFLYLFDIGMFIFNVYYLFVTLRILFL